MLKSIENLFSLQHGMILWMTLGYLLVHVWFYLSERKPRPLLVFLLSAFYILLARLFDFEYWWSNPDTGQWMICAQSLVDQPRDWWTEYSLFDFTRILTILPMALLYAIKGSITYTDAQMLFMGFVLMFVYLQYRTMSIIFQGPTANLAVAIFVAFFTLSSHHDYRLYNSELICVVLFSWAVWFYLKIQQENRGWEALGFLLSVIPFAKEQAAFIAIGAYGVIMFQALMKRDFRSALRLFLGSCLGGGMWFVGIVAVHGIEKTRWFLMILLDYSKSGMKAEYIPVSVKMNTFLHLMLLNREMLVLFPLTILGVMILPRYLRGFQPIKKWFPKVQALYLTTLVIASYTLFSAGNRFIHYTILFWPIIVFYLAVGLEALRDKKAIVIGVFGGFMLLFFALDVKNQTTRLWRDQARYQRESQEWLNDPMVVALHKEGVWDKKVLIWGWDVVAPISMHWERLSGYLYPQFAFGNYESAGSVRSYYLDVMQRREPAYVLEMVGYGRRFFKDPAVFGVDKAFPEMNRILNEDYSLLSQSYNYKLYKRKKIARNQ